MNWHGYLINEHMETVYPIESDYSSKQSVIENAVRCIEEQTGDVINPNPVIVVCSIEAEKNMEEEIELLARDLNESTYGLREGYRIGPTVEIKPRPVDLLARELKGKGRFARYVMDALGDLHNGDIGAMLEDFKVLETC